jgi:hypothetical protein
LIGPVGRTWVNPLDPHYQNGLILGPYPTHFGSGTTKKLLPLLKPKKTKKNKTKDKKNLHSLAKSRLSLVASPHLLHKPLVFWAQNPRSSLSGMRIRHVASTFCICDSGHSVSQQSGHVSYGLNFEKRVRNSGVSFWSKLYFKNKGRLFMLSFSDHVFGGWEQGNNTYTLTAC